MQATTHRPKETIRSMIINRRIIQTNPAIFSALDEAQMRVQTETLLTQIYARGFL